MSIFSGIALAGAVEQGLIYGLMTLGIFLSYRILNVADLTVDGSFALGGAVSALITAEGHPILGLLMGCVCGAIAGIVTGILQTKFKIQPILAGILVMTCLYTINIRIMKGPIISLVRKDTVFSGLAEIVGKSQAAMIIAGAFALIAMLGMMVFLQTPMGRAMRATGDNPDMVRSSSINVDLMKIVCLSMANALVGLSGGLFAQYQSSADSTIGTGMVVVGLASLIIGEVLFFGRRNICLNIIGAVGGSIIYRIIIAFVLSMDASATDLKLISSLIVIVAICVPSVGEFFKERKIRKEGMIYAED